MATLVNIHLIMHIVAGILTLTMGPIAIFSNMKNVKLHRITGKIFFFAMMYTCFSAILGYFRHEGQIFYTFLLGISVLVFGNILRGVRAIQIMKGGEVKRFDFVYTALLALFGIWMIGMGVYNYFQTYQMAISILFGVFGIGTLVSVRENLQRFMQPHLFSKAQWLHFHVSTMIGALTASTTAFTVNTATHYLPWYIQWFGPTLILLPLQFYWKKRLLGQSNKKVQLA